MVGQDRLWENEDESEVDDKVNNNNEEKKGKKKEKKNLQRKLPTRRDRLNTHLYSPKAQSPRRAPDTSPTPRRRWISV